MPLGIISRKDEGYGINDLLLEMKSRLEGGSYGALLTFVGTVRGKTPKGAEVFQLDYEVDEESAREILQKIACEVSRMNGVKEVVICHRFGTFKPGEDVLFVAVAAERSAAGIEAIRTAVSRVKHEAPIWKKESTSEGEYWVGIEGY